ncbi:hypothetical protein HS125_05235 [bacterium]|nr:hypothetical protein [bacterium]
MQRATLVIALASAVLCDAAAQCSLNEKSSYMDWPTVRLSNGVVEVELLPQVGGRVIQVRYDGHEYLWANPRNAGRLYSPDDNGWSNWKNYGGDKLWTAPQGWDGPGQWPGPGDPTHDGGPFLLETLSSGGSEVAVRLTGPTDATTGLQFIREVRLFPGESKVHFINTLRNNGARVQRWGIWQVTQHNAALDGGFNKSLWAFAPMNPLSVYPSGYNVEFGLVGDQQWQPDAKRGLFQLHYQHSVGKVGLDADAGWLAVVDAASGYGFASLFESFPGADYPHKAGVEFWVNGRGEFFAAHQRIAMPTADEDPMYYLESEVHSPFMELAPGESGSIAHTWGLCKAARPVVAADDRMMLFRPLAYVGDDGAAPRGFAGRWEGAFGVFVTGNLELVLQDLSRKSVLRHDFGRIRAGELVDAAGVAPLAGAVLPVDFVPHYGVLRLTPDDGQALELDRCWLY